MCLDRFLCVFLFFHRFPEGFAFETGRLATGASAPVARKEEVLDRFYISFLLVLYKLL